MLDENANCKYCKRRFTVQEWKKGKEKIYCTSCIRNNEVAVMATKAMIAEVNRVLDKVETAMSISELHYLINDLRQDYKPDNKLDFLKG